MIRDVSRLTGRTFDVLVVGGGVYGLTIAYDAAQRGLSVALIERADFGSGSSFNHLRTIHGGLRYLQSLDVRRARESTLERRTLARIAPQTLRPMPFVIPLSPSFLKGPWAMRAGLLMDRVLACDRNRDVPHRLALPPGRVLSTDQAIHEFPELPSAAMSGALVWYDYISTESDRLTFAWAQAAAAHRGVLVNYAEATAVLLDGTRVTGVRAADRHAGGELEIAATVVVNATGAALARLTGSTGIETTFPLIKAMNLVTRRPAGDAALGARTSSGRHLFSVPWRGRALFGTWESGRLADPADRAATESEITTFIDELNGAFPKLRLGLSDVSLVHRGLVPAATAPDRPPVLEAHERILDHASNGIDGLISVAGTKYTTARAVAERVTNHILAKLGRAAIPCRTASVPLPGANGTASASPSDIMSHDATKGISPESAEHLLAAYGARHLEVAALAAERTDWSRPIADHSPVIGAELAWAARHEMVVTLQDAVVRRTPLGALGHPGNAAAVRAAEIVGGELGWSEERRRREIADLQAFYRLG